MYIGIDYGTRRVGIAVSDDAGKVAFPLEVVARGEALVRVVALVRERGVREVVMGESRDFSGNENTVMAAARAFAEDVVREAGVAVHFEPEFLTSMEASRRGRGENPRNADKRSGASATTNERLDASAAAVILQSFLDRQKSATMGRMEEVKEKEVAEVKAETPVSASAPAAAVIIEPAAASVEPTISIDEFHKLDIRIGEIMSAERVPDTDKLLRLKVAFGVEERQIVSGIAAYFPDLQTLVGKRIAFAYNLAPRVIRGLESRGMILGVNDASGFSLLETNGVASGVRVG